MIKQFVPEEFCLKCLGCCRFKEQDSVWAPCLLEEEAQDLMDKDIPAAYISSQRKIMLLPDGQEDNFVCPFLEAKENKCKIYSLRPFECQLYPFLINLRQKRVLLTVDLNCPYLKEKINTPGFKEYVEYLTSYLNSPQQLRRLKDNPQVLQAYEEVTELIELNLDDSAK
jgi:Fe-S-cluster containining protein